ncbi:MAG: autotransporter-associated beta strand repeat-containing protein, partial [Pirellulales bacterium]|nr:autotransporter-associated beta strand repeat-containing protein [Pirellulales bacterium]
SSSKNYTFSGDGKISSGASLVKSGAGTLTIANTGANDFTGTVTITGGTLVVENEYSLGSTVGGTVVDGGTLDFNGRSIRQEPITVRGGGAVVNNNDGHVESLYYVTLTGPAVFGGVEDWFINGENPLNIWEDTFLHGNGNALTKTGTNEVELANIGATNLGDINVTEGTLTVSGNTNLGASAITLSGGAVLKLSDATETVEKTLNVDSTGGVINNASGDGTIAGSGGTLSGLLTVQTAAGTTLELDNALEGTGGLTKENAGTLILGGANAYSGDTTISAGVLELVTGGQIDPDSLIVNHAALEVTSGSHTAGVIEGEGTTTVFGSATLTAASVTQGTLIIGGVSGGGAAATAAPVPEPGVWVLLLAGLLGIGIRRQCAHR